MNPSQNGRASESEVPPNQTPRPKPNLLIVIVPVLLVLITFLFWYQTWFGRQLSDPEMEECLTDTSVPHKTQHALSQLADRLARGDPSAKKWEPQIVNLAANKEAGLRRMAAWVMGEDNSAADFHRALLKLLDDPDLMVRANAALSLVRFNDASGESQLRQMLQPLTLTAPRAGKISYLVGTSDPLHGGTEVAKIELEGDSSEEVFSPMPSKVDRLTEKSGAPVQAGEAVAVLSPSEDIVWEALRGLYFIGQASDLDEVNRYARGVVGMPERVQEQAALTAQAIASRARLATKK